MMTQHPTIICEAIAKSGDTPQWRFWCPHCRSYHHHGGEPDADGYIGHRAAHCHVSTSPYHATGYLLRAGPRRA
jgi:hypothetical protein